MTPMSTAQAERILRQAEEKINLVVAAARFLGTTDRKHLTQTARFIGLQAGKVGRHYAQQERDRK